MKCARAYVATKAEIEPMMKAAKLAREHVKCGQVKGQHISAPNWTLRRGELLGVFDLSAFGDKRDPMVKGVEWVQSQGADVCEVETGAVAGDGVAMLDRGLARAWGRSRRTAERNEEMAAIRRAKKLAGRMPEGEARRIWGDLAEYPTVPKALYHMPGWPRATAFALLGSRKDCEQTLIAERDAARPKRAPAKKSKTKRK